MSGAPRILQSSTPPIQNRKLKPREVKRVVHGHTAGEGKSLISTSGYDSKHFVLSPTACGLDYNAYVVTGIGSNSPCPPFHAVVDFGES